MTALLQRVRRRLRLAWAVAVGQSIAPAVGVFAVALLALGRFRPMPWTPRAAGVTGLAAAVGLLISALAVRIPLSVAARATDRGLHTGDVLATALELGDTRGVLADQVRARAERLARNARATAAVPLRVHRARLGVTDRRSDVSLPPQSPARRYGQLSWRVVSSATAARAKFPVTRAQTSELTARVAKTAQSEAAIRDTSDSPDYRAGVARSGRRANRITAVIEAALKVPLPIAPHRAMRPTDPESTGADGTRQPARAPVGGSCRQISAM